MTPRRGDPSRIRLTFVALLAVGTVACAPDAPTPFVRPSPTPGPPSVRADSWQFDGARWTFLVSVNPHDSATEVAFEYGRDGSFEQRIVVAEDLLDAQALTVQRAGLPDEFCGRFTATNGFGAVSTDPRCYPPDRPPVVIAPSDSPTQSAWPGASG